MRLKGKLGSNTLPVLMGLFLAAAASGQIRLVVTQGSNSVAVSNGTTIAFNTPIGTTANAQVTATYLGLGQLTIERQPSILGSTAFTGTLQSTLPVTLTSGGTVTIDIRYRSVNSSTNNAQLELPFTEIQTANNNSTSVQGTLNLGLLGTAPSFTLSYILQADQNVVALPPNGVLDFASTPANTTAQAALNISNVGSGAGVVTGITVSGEAFKLSRLPLFPNPVGPGQTLQVLALYTPSANGIDEGQIVVTFESGPSAVIKLSGNGVAPNFAFEILRDGQGIPVVPRQTIELPSASVGQTSSVIVQISNTGTAQGTINSISLAGSGFQLADNPPVPLIIAPKASTSFSLLFTPTRAGVLTGSLLVNADRFNLSGTGLGSQVSFSYSAGGSVILLDSNNSAIVFSPTTITQSSQVILIAKNTGTLPTPISNIGVTQNSGPFTVAGLPPLPFSLAPNAELPLTITFAPTVLGFSNGSLRFDNTIVNLIGSGTPPPPLPPFTIGGPSGNVTPGSINNISLSLGAPYPVAVAGTLTLTASGTLPADPAAQFSSGGQTVRFVIPANTTSAVFAGQGTQTAIQTGTVAASLALSAVFETAAGAVDLTPATPTVQRFTILPARPTILALQVLNQTATGFSVSITGYTTTRTLTLASVEFVPAPGVQMSTTQVTIDLSQVSTLWFRSAASQAFGGQFSLSVPFTIQSSAGTAQPVTAITVKLSNEVGESTAVQAKI